MTLHQAHERETKIREWYRQRLANPALLDHAVRLEVHGEFFDIAVPVGETGRGMRRGGYVACSAIRDAKQVYRQLEDRPGFPRLRINYSPHREICHTVEWGCLPPEEDDAARGKFYGYSETAIRDYRPFRGDQNAARKKQTEVVSCASCPSRTCEWVSFFKGRILESQIYRSRPVYLTSD
jgi:hypothetical protein